MRADDAVALIAPAVGDAVGASAAWADLGAGEGTFTRALARLLGAGSVVHAIDRDGRALARLGRTAPDGVAIRAHVADLADGPAIDALALPPLAGTIAANALHFVPVDAQSVVLADWASRLEARGRLIVVEYERLDASPWVPFPIRSAALRAARVPGLTPFDVVARRPSRFGGEMYVAVAQRR